MELEYPRMELYKTRTFSEKLSDTFSFLRENWRPLLKYFTCFMLPASIVLAFFMNHFFSGYLSMSLSSFAEGPGSSTRLQPFILNTIAMVLVGVASYTLLDALLFSLIRLYMRREQRLANVTMAELKPELMLCLRRAVKLVLTGLLLLVAFLLLIVLVAAASFAMNEGVGLMMLLLLYILVFLLIMPLSLVAPLYLLEDDIAVLPAYAKALRLGFATLKGVLAVYFVVGVIVNVLSSFTLMPWYLLTMVKAVFMLSDEMDTTFVNSFAYSCMEYVTCIIQCLGTLLAALISTVAMTIQYGHASDSVDGTGVDEKIESFEDFDNV